MSDYKEYRPFSAENRPVWGLAARWGAVVLGLGVIVVILGFVLGWFGTAVGVISPGNVKQQYADAYSRYASLQATACNVAQERKLVAAATDPDVQVQYQQQETAYEQNYRRLQAEYNAAFNNVFQARRVGPGDLPHTAPDLETDIANC